MLHLQLGEGLLPEDLHKGSVGRVSSVTKTSCKLKNYVSNSLGWQRVSDGLHVSDASVLVIWLILLSSA